MSLGENKLKVLVCDDQLEIREALRLLLKSNGYAVETFADPAELLSAPALADSALVLLDMNYTRDTTSGSEGLELIARLRNLRRLPPLIAMTAWGDISLAVAAMQQGASDFLEKPWNNSRLLQMVGKWSAAQTTAPWSPEAKELASARKVQQNLLPREPRSGLGFEISCRFLPARDVSGDYYDFFEKEPGHFGFVVADVSGKGVPAAILMSNLQALFRSHVTRENLDPAALLASINRFFHQSTAPESFATAFYADFNEASGLLDYIGCGHPPALLRRRSGAFEFLAPQATVLGAFPLWNAASSTLTLAPGDRLLVVSDGAIEAQREIEEFGETRLRDLFDSTASLTPQHALETMEQAILDFSGGQLYDDCTLFLLSVR